jgi:hypothetical protein
MPYHRTKVDYYWIARSFNNTWAFGYVNNSGKRETTIGVAPYKIIAKNECILRSLKRGHVAQFEEV